MKKRLKKYFSIFICMALIVSGMLPGIKVEAQGETEIGNIYYVSKSGNDENDGSFLKPYKTVQKATEVAAPGDTIMIRQGVYDETVTPVTSGIPGKPITITNYKDEIVTISGCEQLTGWEADPNKVGVYRAKMDWCLGELGEMNQVFAGGNLMYEARYPNMTEDSTMLDFPRAKTKSGSGFKSGTGKEQSVLADPDLKEFATTKEFFEGATIWCVPGSKWTALTSHVKEYDPSTGMLTYDSTYRAKTRGYYSPGTNQDYFIYGSYGLLDEKNEWWYDKENQELYLKTPDGKNPDESGLYVEAKKRINGFDLSGCSYINIVGIDIRGTTIITDEDSSHILLKDIDCEYVSHNSEVILEDPSSDACEQQDDLGILVKGSFIEVNGCEVRGSSGPLVNIQGSDNKMINSYVHEGNYSGTYAGHTKLSGSRQLISHNTMADSGRDVVAFRFLSESVIQYNDVYGAAWLTSDVGIMYTANTDGQNTMIHHNHIHDNYADNAPSGLYLDEMSHNFINFCNVVWNVGSGHAYSHNRPTTYILCYNNTSYMSKGIGGLYQQSYVDSRGRHFVNNIANVSDTGGISEYSPKSSYISHNVEDENFIDPANGDFRLSKDSAAIGAGIPLRGVTPEEVENPNAGAYQEGEGLFKVGHNFTNPPQEITVPDRTEFEYRNRVKNGGFELATMDGWDVSGEAVPVWGFSWHTNNAESATGYYAVKLQPGAKITQTVQIEAGEQYTLGLIARVMSEESNLKITVSSGLENEDAVLEESVSTGKWHESKRKFLTFVAGNTSEAIITIENTGESAVNLDDIGVQKDVLEIGSLSKPVTMIYDEHTGMAELSFEALEEGHQYFYSMSIKKDTAVEEGAVRVDIPIRYSYKLIPGTKIARNPLDYVNIVEAVGGKVVGSAALRVVNGEVSEITSIAAVNDGFIRGGQYADIVQNVVNNPENWDSDENSLYHLQLNISGSKDYTRSGYMQFDLSGLDPKLIKSAALKFHVYKTNPDEDGEGADRYLTVNGIENENWDEDSLTWNNAPKEAAPLGSTETFRKISIADGRFFTIDITDYIVMKAGQGTTASVMIKPDAAHNKGNIFITSKENPEYDTAVYAPQLIIEYYSGVEDWNARQKLQNLYNECQKLVKEDYTSDSWDQFISVIKETEKVLNNEDAVKTDFDKEYDNLMKARLGLIEAEESTEETTEESTAETTEETTEESIAETTEETTEESTVETTEETTEESTAETTEETTEESTAETTEETTEESTAETTEETTEESTAETTEETTEESTAETTEETTEESTAETTEETTEESTAETTAESTKESEADTDSAEETIESEFTEECPESFSKTECSTEDEGVPTGDKTTGRGILFLMIVAIGVCGMILAEKEKKIFRK